MVCVDGTHEPSKRASVQEGEHGQDLLNLNFSENFCIEN